MTRSHPGPPVGAPADGDAPEPELEPEPEAAGRVLDARLHLLDRQVLDRDGVPVSTVDDIELEATGDGDAGRRTVVVTNLLTGPVLGTRILGGRPPDRRWIRIPWPLVTGIGSTVDLAADGADLDATWTERWLRDHVIARIPGGRHAPG